MGAPDMKSWQLSVYNLRPFLFGTAIGIGGLGRYFYSPEIDDHGGRAQARREYT